MITTARGTVPARILIVVASATGRTALMADAFAAGAREEGAEVTIAKAQDADASALEEADAVALGSGVHMAGIESEMRSFLERTSALWMQGRLRGRIGAAFVSSGAGARGGAELAILSLLATLAEHGFLLVTMHNRMEGYSAAGCHWGPVAWTSPRDGKAGPTAEHLAACRAHGRHVAQVTTRWLAGLSA